MLDELIRRCRDGDPAAFRRLYDAESPRLYGLALRITGQAALAADAVHDTFLQVWQKASQFDAGRGSAAAWLTALVRYRAIDLVRSHGRETTGHDIPDRADPSPGALDALLASATGAALHRCLALLEEKPRQAIMLAFVEGRTHADLANDLGAPLGTVKSWIRRGLMALKACLDQ